jgi:hypothetical protein
MGDAPRTRLNPTYDKKICPSINTQTYPKIEVGVIHELPLPLFLVPNIYFFLVLAFSALAAFLADSAAVKAFCLAA